MSKKVTIMTDEKFQEELEKIEKLLKEDQEEFDSDYNGRTHFLIGCVTVEEGPLYTPEQLRKIFDLAK